MAVTIMRGGFGIVMIYSYLFGIVLSFLSLAVQGTIVSARHFMHPVTGQETIIFGDIHTGKTALDTMQDMQIAALLQYNKEHPLYKIGYESFILSIKSRLLIQQLAANVIATIAKFTSSTQTTRLQFFSAIPTNSCFFGDQQREYLMGQINRQLSGVALDSHRVTARLYFGLFISLYLTLKDAQFVQSLLEEQCQLSTAAARDQASLFLSVYAEKVFPHITILWQEFAHCLDVFLVQLQQLQTVNQRKEYRECLQFLVACREAVRHKDWVSLYNFSIMPTIQNTLVLAPTDLITLDFILTKHRSLIIVGDCHATNLACYLQEEGFVEQYVTGLTCGTPGGTLQAWHSLVTTAIKPYLAAHCLAIAGITDPHKSALFHRFFNEDATIYTPQKRSVSLSPASQEASGIIHDAVIELQQCIANSKSSMLCLPVDVELFLHDPQGCCAAQNNFALMVLRTLLPLDETVVSRLVMRLIGSAETLELLL
ncbi:hypothetical protein M1466_01740 [Candidatus Dependentiae bacterium]|nr:hypothetical protein [Candidatus Dependentiae bacterium]